MSWFKSRQRPRLTVEALEDRTLLSALDPWFQNFVPPNHYHVGDNALAIVTADFDKDGKADLAVKSQDSDWPPNGGAISVLLGNGDGSFQPEHQYPSGNYWAGTLLAGDFNGDGNLDLVNADVTIEVLLGNGDGTFLPGRTTALSEDTNTFGIGDFNGDDRLDLVARARSGFNFFAGNGDGTFQAALSVPVPGEYGFDVVGVADFNGDGKPDVLATSWSIVDEVARVGLLLGRGDGTFEPYRVIHGGYAVGVTIGDFNADGKLDIVSTDIYDALNNYMEKITVLLGAGDGSFLPPIEFAYYDNPKLAHAGDFNGDGKLDLIVQNGTYPRSYGILLGRGDGTFLPEPAERAGVDTSSYFNAFTMADFNGDGKLDVASLLFMGTHYYDATPNGYVGIMLGNGDGSLQGDADVVDTAGLNNFSVATGDFNGDGKLDAVTTNSDSNTVGVALGRGDGTLAPAVAYPVGVMPLSVAVADFNRDGRDDLAVANFRSNTMSILLARGDGAFQDHVSYAVAYGGGLNPFALTVGDFNGDGTIDVVLANYNGFALNLFLGNGDGTFQAPLIVAAGFRPDSVVAADFNSDGKLDLAVGNYDDSTLSVLFGLGDGAFGPARNYRTDGKPASLVTADFNQDGHADIALLYQYPYDRHYRFLDEFFNNGDGTFQREDVNFGGSYSGDVIGGLSFDVLPPTALAVGDFNRDGNPDFATGVGGLHVNGEGVHGGGSIAIGDFNRDGDPDLLTAQANWLAVRLNYSRTIQFASPTLLAQETNGSVSVTVTLNHASLLPVSVVYATSDVTARAGIDYVATSGTLTFQPGETSKTIAVRMLPAYRSDQSDTFRVTLRLPQGAVLNQRFPDTYQRMPLMFPNLDTTVVTVIRKRTSVQKGLIGGIGFWHSDRGQALIMQMGGPLLYNSLGGWLIYNFGNLYGAPYENGLRDTTNAGVASYFQKLFDMPGPRLEAKVLALALSVYATTRSLGGNVAEAYGFTVTDHGLFAYTFNVGADGAAFGVANNSVVTIYELLQAVNARVNRTVLYYFDPALRKKATDLFGKLDDAGAI